MLTSAQASVVETKSSTSEWESLRSVSSTDSLFGGSAVATGCWQRSPRICVRPGHHFAPVHQFRPSAVAIYSLIGQFRPETWVAVVREGAGSESAQGRHEWVEGRAQLEGPHLQGSDVLGQRPTLLGQQSGEPLIQ